MKNPRARRALVGACFAIAVLSVALPASARQGAGDSNAAASSGARTDDSAAPTARPDGDDADADADADSDAEDPEATPTPPPPPPVTLSGLAPGPVAGLDIELAEALERTGLTDAWYLLTTTEPGLALVAVDGAIAEQGRAQMLVALDGFGDTVELVATLRQSRQATGLKARNTATRISEVESDIAALDRSIDDTERILDGLGDDLDQVLTAIREAAVGLYTSQDQGPISAMGDVDAFNAHAELVVRVDATFEELRRQRLVLESDIADQEEALRILLDDRTAARQVRDDLTTQLAELNDAIDRLSTRIDDGLVDRNTRLRAMPAAITAAHEARALGTLAALPFPMVNLDAYVRAHDDVTAVYPGCGVPWYLLAGIVRIESGHATFGGATVAANGDVSQRILGPLLDGSLAGTMVITDTDGGALDGNADFDAAVGPFQFIPSTWVRHALDSTGDGFADPHNIYDAALTAAGYLCASSDVRSDLDIERSVLSYNRSRAYLANVTSAARTYATALSLPDADLAVIVQRGPKGWRDEGWDRDAWRADDDAVVAWLVNSWGRTGQPELTDPPPAEPADPAPFALPFADNADSPAGAEGTPGD